MTSSSKLFVIVFTFLALAASADAQSPREQLQQMVEQLQKTPTDNALREKIIKLGAEIKPAPAIPEEANRAFVKGNVFQKEAKDASGYDLAISAYREALRLAPWWGDVYYNLAVALESANKFDEAIASIKFFMVSVSGGSAEAREAQNRVYAIEAKSEMASKQAAARAAAERERKKTEFAGLVGTWLPVDVKSDPRDWRGLRERARYPDSAFHRYRFVVHGEDKVLLYMDQHGGQWDHTPEDFWTIVYTGTRTSGGWKWTTRNADPRCGQNEVVRTVQFEVLEQGRVIRTRGIQLLQQSRPEIGMMGYSISAGPAGCVVAEYPMMFIRVSD